MDKLLALRLFVATVDAKGFSAAARSLGLAPSSVTRMIDALETDLGTVLLNRSTRQVSVSEAGALYYLRARKLLDELAEADALVKDGDGEPSGPLRISVPTEFGRRCIAPYLGGFLARYPKLELDMTLTDAIVDLLTERVDLSIRLGSPQAQDDVICRVVGRFERRIVASPAYLATRGAPSEPADLVGHECLRFNYGPAQQTWLFQQGDDEQRVLVHGRMKSNNAEVLRELALAGTGVALLAHWLVDADIAAGKLVQLFPDCVVNPNSITNAISALYLPNHRGSKRVKAFIGFMTEILAV